jgi:acyl-[acyl-carrier-protein]-phospholipid O-acyltransferase/long-chain-fatty-acid--[acyl-carrier-protein] ligase
VKVVDLQSGEDLGTDRPGMLLVRGPNVMKGYLGDPALTAEVMRNGWYVTGDIAAVDGDGFLRLVDRLGRFSKMGGEMVPHIRVEEAIRGVLGLEGVQAQFIVTAVPDEKKGERLIVLHTGLPQTPEAISRQLGRQGLPALWIPSPDSFCQVDHLPLTGIGKPDLARTRNLALERFAPSRQPETGEASAQR